MSIFNIAPVFELKNKYGEIKSITIGYEHNLIIMVKFYNATELPLTVLGQIYDTLNKTVTHSKVKWSVGESNLDGKYLLFQAIEEKKEPGEPICY